MVGSWAYWMFYKLDQIVFGIRKKNIIVFLTCTNNVSRNMELNVMDHPLRTCSQLICEIILCCKFEMHPISNSFNMKILFHGYRIIFWKWFSIPWNIFTLVDCLYAARFSWIPKLSFEEKKIWDSRKFNNKRVSAHRVMHLSRLEMHS